MAESFYMKHNAFFYCILSVSHKFNKASHYLISPTAALFSTMRALSTKTTGMEVGCTAGPQATGSLVSSTSTERKDTDINCSRMEAPFR